MIKVIVFDADGVLINGEIFSAQYSKDFEVPSEKMLPFFTGKFQECLVGKADLKDEVAKHLKDWKWNKSVDEFLDYWFKTEHKIDEEIITYIKYLKTKGIICCLGTNQEKYRTEYMLQQMGFNQIFDHIFSSAYVGHRKPQKEFFQHIVDTLACRKDEVVLWDDTQGHIQSAKEFGIHAELYTSYTDFKKNAELSELTSYYRRIAFDCISTN